MIDNSVIILILGVCVIGTVVLLQETYSQVDEEDSDMITLNNSNIKVRQECLDIREPSLNGDLEVSVWKFERHYYFSPVDIPCENWREVVQYYLDNGYMVRYELDIVVGMLKRN